MHTFEVIEAPQGKTVAMCELPEGALAVIDESPPGKRNGRVVLRTDGRNVDLSRPQQGDWGPDSGIRCRLLPPGTKIVLTVQ